MIKKCFGLIVPRYQGIAPILIGLLFSVTLLCLSFRHLHFPQLFPDLVAGYVGYYGLDKSQDTRAFLLLVGLLCVLPILITHLCLWIAPGGNRFGVGKAVQQLLLLSLVPVAWRLAVDCAQPVPVVPQFNIVCLFPGMALIGLLSLRRYRDELQPQHVLPIGGAIVLTIFFSLFVGFALCIFCVRLFPFSYPYLTGAGATFAWTSGIVSLTAVVVSIFLSSTIALFQSRVLGLLKLVQFPLVLLFFQLVPPPFVDPQHRFSENYPTVLVVFLSTCILISWYSLWRRFASSALIDAGSVQGNPLSRSIGPAAVAALLVYVYCPVASLPSLSLDDFHWGEQAIPWQQLFYFHKIPYVDFVPIHGLMSYLRGIFMSVFFDGTAASYAEANILLMGLATTALALATCSVVSPLGALLLLGGTLPDSDRMYFYVPALLAISATRVVSNPVRLLVVWLIVAGLMFGYNPTQGPAFTLGTLPVALWAGRRAYLTQRLTLIRLTLLVSAIATTAIWIPLVRHIGLAFVTFVIDNGSTNNLAHGVPWSQGRFIRIPMWGPGSTEFLWEITRSFWILFAFICAAIFWKHLSNVEKSRLSESAAPRRTSLLVLSGSIPFYLLLWSPWINGRISPGGFAYAGDVSHTCLFWLVPTVVLLAVRSRSLPAALLALAAISGFFYPTNPTHIDPDEMRQKCVAARVVPANVQLTDGREIGMPRIGRVLKPNALAYLKPIKSFLDGFLKPGETFFDFTNRTAIYYYLDLPYPVRYVRL